MRKGFATGPRKNDGIKRKFQKQGKAGSQSLDRVESHASNFPIHLFDHLTQCNRSRYDSYVLHTSVHLLAMLKKYYPTAPHPKWMSSATTTQHVLQNNDYLMMSLQYI